LSIEEIKEEKTKRDIINFSNSLKRRVEEGEDISEILSFMEKGKDKIELPSAIEEENLTKNHWKLLEKRVPI